jgi:hypothetical protein
VSYFADLTPYSYRQLSEAAKRAHIGCLDSNHAFERDDLPAEVIARIEEMCKSPLRRIRGWQNCPICQKYLVTHRLQDRRQMTLGTGAK